MKAALLALILSVSACVDDGASAGITGEPPDTNSCPVYFHGVQTCEAATCGLTAGDLECYAEGVPCWCYSQQTWCLKQI